MNHSRCVIRRPWPLRVRTVAIIIAMTVLPLLAAACSTSSSSPNAGGATNSQSAASYSRCVRSHGIPSFPDPNSSGQIPKATAQQLGVSDSVLQAAQAACENLYPNSTQGGQTQQQQQLSAYLAFAQCMRSHRVPNWPDPTNNSHGPRFSISVSRDGFDPRSSQIAAKAHGCLSVLPAGSGLPLVTVTS